MLSSNFLRVNVCFFNILQFVTFPNLHLARCFCLVINLLLSLYADFHIINFEIHTVELLLSSHPWGTGDWPLNEGWPLSRGLSISIIFGRNTNLFWNKSMMEEVLLVTFRLGLYFPSSYSWNKAKLSENFEILGLKVTQQSWLLLFHVFSSPCFLLFLPHFFFCLAFSRLILVGKVFRKLSGS